MNAKLSETSLLHAVLEMHQTPRWQAFIYSTTLVVSTSTALVLDLWFHWASERVLLYVLPSSVGLLFLVPILVVTFLRGNAKEALISIREFPSPLSRFYFTEIRISIVIFLWMLVPVMGVMTLQQLFVPTAEVNRMMAIDYPAADEPNLGMYVFYLTSAVAQVIVATLVIIILRRKLRDNISEPKRRAIEIGVYSFVVVILAVFVIGDSFHPVLARLSHERIYRVLERSSLFSPYFRSFPGVLVGSSSFPGFYLFSILSAGLIILGLIVIVLTCFNLGKDLVKVRNRINSQLTASDRQDLDSAIRGFDRYCYILSAVLMTSTIVTGLFFQLPLTTIAPGEAYTSFRDVSTAMTMCWGVTFSLTMLAMWFYPYFRIQNDLRILQRESKVNNDAELARWLDDLRKEYVVYTNVKSLLSIFLPAIVAVLSRFI